MLVAKEYSFRERHAMTDQPSQTLLTEEQINDFRYAAKRTMQAWIEGDYVDALCDMALALFAARRDAELLDGIEKHHLMIYYTHNEWRGKKESGWTYWEMFGPEGPELYPTAREAIRAGIDEAVMEAKLDAAKGGQ